MEKEYTLKNSREFFRDTWKYSPKAKKKELLKVIGAHHSWSEAKGPEEMVKRGGGAVVKKLGGIMDEYLKRSPGGKVRIKWRP